MTRIKGLDAHLKRLNAMQGAGFVRTIGKGLFAGGQKIQNEAQHSITQGAVSGKNHVPSKPGEPPNQDTGVLGAGITTVQVEPLTVEVSSNAPYAADLEFGTSKMAARPYMRPARDKMKDEVKKDVIDAANHAIRKSRSK